jgi:hypothetical protein
MLLDHLTVISQVDPEAWDRDVVRLNGNALHTHTWSCYSGESHGATPLYFILKDISGHADAVSFGLYTEKKAGVRLYSSLSFGSMAAASSPEHRKNMTHAILKYCERKRIVALSMNSFGTPHGSEIIPEMGFYSSRRWEFVLNIEGTEKELWDKIHGKKRNLIRKGQKEGLVVANESGKESLLLFQNLAAETYERKAGQGISYPPPGDVSAYQRMHDHLVTPGLGRLYLAFKGEKVVAGAFFVAFNGQVYYMLSSASDEGLKTAAPDLVLWTAMTDFQKEGFRLFNFGGLSESELNGQPLEQSGLYHFKHRFSPEVLPCFKGKHVLRPIQHRAYSFIRKSKSMAGQMLRHNP